MRICSKCQTEKEESEFYKKGSRLHSYCKSCFNEYCIERWTTKKKHYILEFGGKCVKCPFSFDGNNHSVFEFHHLYDKKFDWNKLRLKSPDKIQAELSKCQLLCANCHRLEHWCLRRDSNPH